MNKLLTISVAAYNVEASLDQTLSSLVTDSDTMSLIEVIVVDDGSSDSTAQIAEKYVTEYPDTFRLIRKNNGGYGSTINRSVKEAEGKYFKQLDGGDIYITENLSGFVTFLSGIDSDLVVTPYEEVFLQDNKEVLRNSYSDLGKKADVSISALDGPHMIKMHELAFKTSVWNELGRNIPEHCFYTDTEYVLYPLIHSTTVSFFDLPIYRYFLQCGGQSVSYEGMCKHYPDSETMMWDVIEVYSTYSGSVGTSQKNIMLGILRHAAAFAYTAYFTSGKKQIKLLQNIDKRMKSSYPEIYKLTDSVKRIQLMRRTGFLLYGVYGHIMRGSEG